MEDSRAATSKEVEYLLSQFVCAREVATVVRTNYFILDKVIIGIYH